MGAKEQSLITGIDAIPMGDMQLRVNDAKQDDIIEGQGLIVTNLVVDISGCRVEGHDVLITGNK